LEKFICKRNINVGTKSRSFTSMGKMFQKVIKFQDKTFCRNIYSSALQYVMCYIKITNWYILCMLHFTNFINL